jgi:hypothetical protein
LVKAPALTPVLTTGACVWLWLTWTLPAFTLVLTFLEVSSIVLGVLRAGRDH